MDYKARKVAMLSAFSHQLTEFIDVVQTSAKELDRDQFRRNILDSINDYVPSDRSILILQNDGARFPDFFRRNINEKKDQEYIKYYYSLDPFANLEGGPYGCRLVSSLPHRKTVVALEEIIAYPAFTSSEYYTDFLLPMNAHHELEIYLEQDSRLKGFIALLRSRKSRSFSEEEIRMAQAFSPIISLGLENVMLREKVELDKTVVGIMENFPSCGCMLFSQSCKPLFMNRKAKEICIDLNNGSHSNQKKMPEVPTRILKNIETYQKEAALDQSNYAPLLKEDIIKCKEVYRTTYQICSERPGGTCEKKILVLIDQINKKQNLALEKAVSIFGLSRREADVVQNIYEGQKNSEIARRLCISELTVKTHIQNIFEKMKVNSRAAVVYTIMSKF